MGYPDKKLTLVNNNRLYDSNIIFSYILIVVASFWIFDVLPISVTALIPYILLPSFGLLSSGEVAAQYMSNTNMLLVGGFMV